jgi:hypothetical protein
MVTPSPISVPETSTSSRLPPPMSPTTRPACRSRRFTPKAESCASFQPGKSSILQPHASSAALRKAGPFSASRAAGGCEHEGLVATPTVWQSTRKRTSGLQGPPHRVLGSRRLLATPAAEARTEASRCRSASAPGSCPRR